MDRKKFFFVMCSYFCLITSAIEPTVEQLNQVNLAEIIAGPQISRDLNERLIKCLGKNKTANCPSDSIPIPESFRLILELNKLAEPHYPVNAPGADVENTRILIPNFLSNGQERVVRAIQQTPIGLRETLPGAKNRAQALVALAGGILTVTRKPDSADPYQDISNYVKTKNPSNVKYNAGKVMKNKQSLADTFATTNAATVRRFGANYDPRVSNVLITGVLKTLVHL